MTDDAKVLGLNAVIHGESGVGKSWLIASMPGPRLILDAEGGSRFAPATAAERKPGAKVDPSLKILWDPRKSEPPKKGKWQTCIVICREFDVFDLVYKWLDSGQHPFESVGMDTLMEIQSRCIENISGKSQVTERNWGEILRNMEDLVRKYRDLVLDDARKPLKAVVFASGTKSYEDGKLRPLLQGQMRDKLPHFVDLVGYMKTALSSEGTIERRLLIQPYDQYVAKDRTNVLTQHYGPVITNPDLTEMLAVVNGSLDQEGK